MSFNNNNNNNNTESCLSPSRKRMSIECLLQPDTATAHRIPDDDLESIASSSADEFESGELTAGSSSQSPFPFSSSSNSTASRKRKSFVGLPQKSSQDMVDAATRVDEFFTCVKEAGTVVPVPPSPPSLFHCGNNDQNTMPVRKQTAHSHTGIIDETSMASLMYSVIDEEDSEMVNHNDDNHANNNDINNNNMEEDTDAPNGQVNYNPSIKAELTESQVDQIMQECSLMMDYPTSSSSRSDDQTPATKPKRKRANLFQLAVLGQVYKKSPFPSTKLRELLAVKLGMEQRAVQIWFQNRRQNQKTFASKTGKAAKANNSGSTSGSSVSPSQRRHSSAVASTSASVPMVETSENGSSLSVPSLPTQMSTGSTSSSNSTSSSSLSIKEMSEIITSCKNELSQRPNTLLFKATGFSNRGRANVLQVSVLSEVFKRCQFPDASVKKFLAGEIDMTEKAIQTWFQNRRQNHRTSLALARLRRTRSSGEFGCEVIHDTEGLDCLASLAAASTSSCANEKATGEYGLSNLVLNNSNDTGVKLPSLSEHFQSGKRRKSWSILPLSLPTPQGSDQMLYNSASSIPQTRPVQIVQPQPHHPMPSSLPVFGSASSPMNPILSACSTPSNSPNPVVMHQNQMAQAAAYASLFLHKQQQQQQQQQRAVLMSIYNEQQQLAIKHRALQQYAQTIMAGSGTASNPLPLMTNQTPSPAAKESVPLMTPFLQHRTGSHNQQQGKSSEGGDSPRKL